MLVYQRVSIRNEDDTATFVRNMMINQWLFGNHTFKHVQTTPMIGELTIKNGETHENGRTICLDLVNLAEI